MLANLLASNSAWLYEAALHEPIPGHDFLSNPKLFNHCGGGSGAPIPTVQNTMRGWIGKGAGFSDALTLSGEQQDQLVGMILPDFHTGSTVDGVTRGFNWRRADTIAITPHVYCRKARTRVQAQRSAGTLACRLNAALFADPLGQVLMATGTPVYLTDSSQTVCELTLDLGDAPYLRSERVTTVWYWGIQAWVPPGCTLKIGESADTAPCLALTSE
jgi:hypothetical protein